MPTAAVALAALESAMASALSATQLESDFLTDETIPAGATRFSVRAGAGLRIPDSNLKLDELALIVTIYYRLDSTERAYTRGKMLTDMTTLIDPAFWRLPSVLEVQEGPAFDVNDIARTGDVVSWSLIVRLTVAP